MLKISSFKELVPPVGLFPEKESEFLKVTLNQIISGIAHLSFDEINDLIKFTADINKDVTKTLDVPDVHEMIFSTLEKLINGSPSEIKQSPIYKLFNMEIDEPEPQNIKEPLKSLDLKDDFKLFTPLMSVCALQEFVKMTDNAKAIQKENAVDDAYYRLGKVYLDLRAVDALLNIPKMMSQEILAVDDKEQIDSELHRQKSQKGGSSSHQDKITEKMIFLNQYKIDNELSPISNKNEYVHKYLSNMNKHARNRLSTTGAARYLLDAIRDFKKGKFDNDLK